VYLLESPVATTCTSGVVSYFHPRSSPNRPLENLQIRSTKFPHEEAPESTCKSQSNAARTHQAEMPMVIDESRHRDPETATSLCHNCREGRLSLSIDLRRKPFPEHKSIQITVVSPSCP